MTRSHVSPAELQELRRREPRLRLVDVRSGGEFESVHIPGSYNVPIDALHEHRRDLVDLGDPVVLVCGSGIRAARAETALVEAGMTNVRVLAGGLDGWERAGGETATIRERWAMDRQVRLVAGGIVLASVVASSVLPKAKWLAAGVGGGLAAAAVTNSCAMGALLARLPYNRTRDRDVHDEIVRLRKEALAA